MPSLPCYSSFWKRLRLAPLLTAWPLLASVDSGCAMPLVQTSRHASRLDATRRKSHVRRNSSIYLMVASASLEDKQLNPR